MQPRIIILEVRKPRTKEERGVFGMTVTEDGYKTNIFINENQTGEEMVDTFFHEVAHAYLHWIPKKYKPGKAEALASLVGHVAGAAWKGQL